MRFDYDKLNAVNELAVSQIEDIFHSFRIKFRFDGKRYVTRCNIHGGDNPSAFQLYKDGYVTKGNWQCATKACHKAFIPTVIGFVRGMLSSQNGWHSVQDTDKIVPFKSALDWLCSFLKQDFNKIRVDKDAIEKARFISQTSVFRPSTKPSLLNVSRQLVRSRLDIPAEYYLNRDFSRKVLEDFDVGACRDQYKEMTGRVVVPIYDDTGKWLVGATGRSIYEKCGECEYYHNPDSDCPTSDIDINNSTKWRHSSGFHAENHLYNWWNAKGYISKTGVAVLVESPGNVWRLEEAGIKNAVAMFGTGLKPRQKYLLDCSGALSLIYIPDNDTAGLESIEYLKKQCSRTYRLFFPTIKADDVGEMTADAVTEEIKPFIDTISEVNL